MSARATLVAAAILGFLGVTLGAFGAHVIEHSYTPLQMIIWHVAVQYQFYHALALLAVGLWMRTTPMSSLRITAWAFTVGAVLFSGSLYLMVLTGTRWLGVITPLGGVAFLIGWGALVVSAWRSR